MSIRITFREELMRAPELSDVTKLRYEYADDCDETICTGQEAEWPTPHIHLILSGEGPEAGPKHLFLRL